MLFRSDAEVRQLVLGIPAIPRMGMVEYRSVAIHWPRIAIQATRKACAGTIPSLEHLGYRRACYDLHRAISGRHWFAMAFHAVCIPGHHDLVLRTVGNVASQNAIG